MGGGNGPDPTVYQSDSDGSNSGSDDGTDTDGEQTRIADVAPGSDHGGTTDTPPQETEPRAGPGAGDTPSPSVGGDDSDTEFEQDRQLTPDPEDLNPRQITIDESGTVRQETETNVEETDTVGTENSDTADETPDSVSDTGGTPSYDDLPIGPDDRSTDTDSETTETEQTRINEQQVDEFLNSDRDFDNVDSETISAVIERGPDLPNAIGPNDNPRETKFKFAAKRINLTSSAESSSQQAIQQEPPTTDASGAQSTESGEPIFADKDAETIKNKTDDIEETTRNAIEALDETKRTTEERTYSENDDRDETALKIVTDAISNPNVSDETREQCAEIVRRRREDATTGDGQQQDTTLDDRYTEQEERPGQRGFGRLADEG